MSLRPNRPIPQQLSGPKRLEDVLAIGMKQQMCISTSRIVQKEILNKKEPPKPTITKSDNPKKKSLLSESNKPYSYEEPESSGSKRSRVDDGCERRIHKLESEITRLKDENKQFKKSAMSRLRSIINDAETEQQKKEITLMNHVEQITDFGTCMKNSEVFVVTSLCTAMSINYILVSANVIEIQPVREFHAAARLYIAYISAEHDVMRQIDDNVMANTADISGFLDGPNFGQNQQSVFNEPTIQGLLYEYMTNVTKFVTEFETNNFGELLDIAVSILRGASSVVVAAGSNLSPEMQQTVGFGVLTRLDNEYKTWPIKQAEMCKETFMNLTSLGTKPREYWNKLSATNDAAKLAAQNVLANDISKLNPTTGVRWDIWNKGLVEQVREGLFAPVEYSNVTTGQYFNKFVSMVWKNNVVFGVQGRIAMYLIGAATRVLQKTIAHRIDALEEFSKVNEPATVDSWIKQIKIWNQLFNNYDAEKEAVKQAQKKGEEEKKRAGDELKKAQERAAKSKQTLDPLLEDLSNEWKDAHKILRKELKNKPGSTTGTSAVGALATTIGQLLGTLNGDLWKELITPVLQVGQWGVDEAAFFIWRRRVMEQVSIINRQIVNLANLQTFFRKELCQGNESDCVVPEVEDGAVWKTPPATPDPQNTQKLNDFRHQQSRKTYPTNVD